MSKKYLRLSMDVLPDQPHGPEYILQLHAVLIDPEDDEPDHRPSLTILFYHGVPFDYRAQVRGPDDRNAAHLNTILDYRDTGLLPPGIQGAQSWTRGLFFLGVWLEQLGLVLGEVPVKFKYQPGIYAPDYLPTEARQAFGMVSGITDVVLVKPPVSIWQRIVKYFKGLFK